jgi:hypothetical protein
VEIQSVVILEDKDLDGLVTQEAQEDDEWKRKDKKARAIIKLTLSDDVIPFVVNAATTKEVWDELDARFNQNSCSNKYFLRRKLYNTKKLETESMNCYFGRLRSLKQLLLCINVNIPDDEFSALMLNGLPKSYEMTISNLESQDNLTPGKVESRLLLEEQKQNEEPRVEEKIAFSMNTNKKANKYKDITCHYCKRRGHIKRMCRKRQEDLKNHHSFMMSNGDGSKCHDWVVDTGASDHMCWDKDLFDNVKPWKIAVYFGDGTHVMSEGVGSVWLKSNSHTIELKNTLYIPSLNKNFFSVPKFNLADGISVFGRTGCTLKKDNLVMNARKEGDMFVLDLKSHSLSSLSSNDLIIWHRRLGHLSERNLKKVLIKMNSNWKFTKLPFCEVCAQANNIRKPYSGSHDRVLNVLQLVHTDVCGPLPTSIGGSRYYVSFTDDCSRFTHLYFIRQKSEVFEKFKEYKLVVEKQTGKIIKTLHSDGGGEYISKSFQSFLINNGITRKITSPYSPQQNGIAERLNRTLIERARTMITDSGLSENFWAEAVATSAYIKNRTPTKILNGLTPYDVMFSKSPDISNLKVWGCFAYVKNNHPSSKLAPRSIKMRFVGYDSEHSGYRMWNGKRIVISRDVIFDETDNSTQNIIFSENTPSINLQHDDDYLFTCDTESEEEDEAVLLNEVENPQLPNPVVEEPVEIEQPDEHEIADLVNSSDSDDNDQTIIPVRRSTRIKKPNPKYLNNICTDPSDHREILKLPDKDKWLEAMNNEFSTLSIMNTWELVNSPDSQTVLPCKWVFKKKLNPDGSIERYKARLVAKGFKQLEGTDYNELFSPVVKYETIRLMLSLSAVEDYEIHHLDVKSAFLHGHLEEKIYMHQPPLFEDGSNRVCLLKKSLYGLKQAPREWNRRLTDVLIQNNFYQSKLDHCLFYRGSTYILVYVDDLILISENMKTLELAKTILIQNFHMKDLGPLTFFLGIEIMRNRGKRSITLNQRAYISRLISSLKMDGCNGVSTPLDANTNLTGNINSHKIENVPYCNVVGALIYLSTTTRADISYAVNILSRYLISYTAAHWKAVKRLIRYLS